MILQQPSILLLTLVHAVPSFTSSIPAILKASDSDWQSLNTSLDGRLGVLKPLGEPCYLRYDANGPTRSHAPDLGTCQDAQKHRGDVNYISSQPAGYHDAFYGACMAEGHWCPLTDLPKNGSVKPLPGTCYQGNVPDYFIDVREVSDIQKGFNFADEHGIPVVVKNTGHDYKGRSAGRHSLAIWY